MPVRVLLADHHPLDRHGLRSLLAWEGFQVVAEAADSRDALRRAEATRPEVAVIDLTMPGMNGLDTAREIMRISAHTRTVLLSQHVEERYVLEALRAGVHGYVHKRRAMSDVIEAIREVHRGGLYLSPTISHAVIDVYRKQGGLTWNSLTARERAVLRLVAEGKSTKQVAESLAISVKTADAYRRRVTKKLGPHEVAGLVRCVLRLRPPRP